VKSFLGPGTTPSPNVGWLFIKRKLRRSKVIDEEAVFGPLIDCDKSYQN
jgi:hypothetical protein